MEARIRATLMIIHFTGVRVGNLRALTAKNYHHWHECGQITHPLTKGGESTTSTLSASARECFQNYHPSLSLLSMGKELLDPLFTSEKKKSVVISRETLTKEVNVFLANSWQKAEFAIRFIQGYLYYGCV